VERHRGIDCVVSDARTPVLSPEDEYRYASGFCTREHLDGVWHETPSRSGNSLPLAAAPPFQPHIPLQSLPCLHTTLALAAVLTISRPVLASMTPRLSIRYTQLPLPLVAAGRGSRFRPNQEDSLRHTSSHVLDLLRLTAPVSRATACVLVYILDR